MLVVPLGFAMADGIPIPDTPVTTTAPAEEPAAPAPQIDPTIVGDWLWIEADTPVGSLTPLPRQEYVIAFRDDGSVSITAESNQINGTYTADGTIVAIELQASTRAAWLPGSPAPRLLELLAEARDYGLDGEQLQLETLGGRGSLNFDPMN
jgi:heat shock protein HslJ